MKGWLALLAAPLAAAEFSHKAHLALRPDCAVCHPAAASSKAMTDNLLPRPEACAPCHNPAPPIAAPRQTPIRAFDHSLHTKLGNIASVLVRAIDNGDHLAVNSRERRARLDTKLNCAGCHQGVERAETRAQIAGPGMSDCLVCHNRIEVPFSCAQCHAPGMKLKPDNHTANFIDGHTDIQLAKTDCRSCHGRSFTCMGCH
jgi:hypothetical protein